MSMLETDSVPRLEQSLSEMLERRTEDYGIKLKSQTLGGKFQDVISGLFRVHGPVVVLVDEYDKPILDNMGELERADAMRQVLRSFYTVLKGCDEHLRFVMLTGIAAGFGLWVPMVIAVARFRPSIVNLWLTLPLYVFVLAAVFVLRWARGKWRAIRLTQEEAR